jgi:hypothetical protein
MLFLCIEKKIGLISGCRNLEFFFLDYRSSTVIPMRSIGKVGARLKERED